MSRPVRSDVVDWMIDHYDTNIPDEIQISLFYNKLRLEPNININLYADYDEINNYWWHVKLMVSVEIEQGNKLVNDMTMLSDFV